MAGGFLEVPPCNVDTVMTSDGTGTERLAPLIGISRLRMGSDGRGITTLVAFYGCPLRCRHCLNPQCLPDNAPAMQKTSDEVAAILRKDELYFRATGGGVTFGGGEPLLHDSFIREVLEKTDGGWHTTVETSLNVPRPRIGALLPFIDEWIVDVKDMNPQTYRGYTSRDNAMVLENLRWLVSKGRSDGIVCRVPLIPGFNDEAARQGSVAFLKSLGLSRFDLFTYRVGPNEFEAAEHRKVAYEIRTFNTATL
mgnify:CR=1 FL=1